MEGYHQLSSKTRMYFATLVSIWDADFYVKVDDDVHVNLGEPFLSSFSLVLCTVSCKIYDHRRLLSSPRMNKRLERM